MKFNIEKVILWPKKSELGYRAVDFVPNKINIITGASRTGKSAIIPIIDYCLGSEKCTIPVDTIRNATSWFGILISLDKEKMLLCRKEPGKQLSTGSMYIARGNDLKIPEIIVENTNANEINNILNELFSMSFLSLDPEGDSFSKRPSYRDFMAFLFQPQNIIANADVMFYKADTMEHRQKLINIFPYALGAVTPQILAARQELEQLKNSRERLQKDLNAIKNVAEEWKQEVFAWLAQAKELGFIERYDASLSFDEQLEVLSGIVKKSEIDSDIRSSNVQEISSEIIALRKEEQEISSRLFALQKRHTEMLQLKNSLGNYENSLKIQVQRLEISKWLKELSRNEEICPFCNQPHSKAMDELDILCDAVAEIEKSADNIKIMPAAFQRELHIVENEINDYTEKLYAVKKRLASVSGVARHNADKKYTLSGISRFLGRLETSLQTLNKIGKDSELENRIASLTEKINKLSAEVDEWTIRRKQEAALMYINQRIGEIVKTLDTEHPDTPVEFIIKDLTLKLKNASGRDDYLWEIGSASNWLAYHIATSLALQQFFQVRGKVSVPSFIVYDQPSQVYFPHHIKADIDDINLEDEDKNAVKKIFKSMAAFLKEVGNSVQIIVTEHADADIWGDVESVHLVERWRGENKLIPSNWL